MDSDFSKTQEFYDLMSTFERTHKHMRLDREKRGDTPAGNWYQSGETNDVFKQYLDGYMAGRAVYLAHADEAKADAALGRAVRRIPDMAKLWHAESRWYLHPGDAPCLPLGTGNSPEAALKAAGLMEVKG